MNTDARDRAANLDFWSSPVAPEPLDGGITNTNFVVDHRGELFVVRVGEDIPVHGVMRFNEIAAEGARLRNRKCVSSRTWNVLFT
jgi:hypothetical protein